MFGLDQWGQATTQFFVNYPTFTNFLIGVFVVAALFVKHIRGHYILSGYPFVGWVVVSLFLYSLTSAIWSPRPNLSFYLWLVKGPYIITIVILTPFLISQIRDVQIGLSWLVVIGSILTLLLLFFVEWEYRQIVIAGQAFGNPLAVSQMAGYTALALILANSWRNRMLWKLIKWPIIAICLVLAIKSGSRGQLFGIILATIVFLPFSYRVRNIKGFIFLVFIISCISLITNWALHEFWEESSRWSQDQMQDDVGGRLHMAAALLGHWWSSPMTILFGLGNSASYDPHIIGMYPHIVPLEVLAEEGIIGFGLFLSIIVLSIRSINQAYKYVKNDQEYRGLLATISAMFLFAFILSLKQGSMIGSLDLFMTAIILGKFEKIMAVQIVKKNKNIYDSYADVVK